MVTQVQTADTAVAAVLALDNVLFRWGKADTPCLDIAAFSLARTEHVFLRGPSGSGKSTLLSLLGGVLLPQRGKIEIAGVDLTKMRGSQRDRFRAANIGFIFQLFNLVPYLSALENIVLPCRFSRERSGRLNGSIYDEARRLASRLELDEVLLHRPAARLSVGQQQRVAAARALIGRPCLVIADEPTSALDANRQRLFLNLLLSECAAAGASLLFVSHDERLQGDFTRVLEMEEINRLATVQR